MSNNTLPDEEWKRIKTIAALRSDHNEGKSDSSFRNGFYSGYISGATDFHSHVAIKLLKKFISRHEAGLLPDVHIYNEIKSFLDGSK